MNGAPSPSDKTGRNVAIVAGVAGLGLLALYLYSRQQQPPGVTYDEHGCIVGQQEWCDTRTLEGSPLPPSCVPVETCPKRDVWCESLKKYILPTESCPPTPPDIIYDEHGCIVDTQQWCPTTSACIGQSDTCPTPTTTSTDQYGCISINGVPQTVYCAPRGCIPAGTTCTDLNGCIDGQEKYCAPQGKCLPTSTPCTDANGCVVPQTMCATTQKCETTCPTPPFKGLPMSVWEVPSIIPPSDPTSQNVYRFGAKMIAQSFMFAARSCGHGEVGSPEWDYSGYVSDIYGISQKFKDTIAPYMTDPCTVYNALRRPEYLNLANNMVSIDWIPKTWSSYLMEIAVWY